MLAAALATLVIGHSAEGREIRATRVGDVHAPVKVLVVGDVHGNEPAGEAIVAALRRADVDGVQLWLVRTANPDGRAAHTRQNARGVDLNRNFPYRWAAGERGTYYPGPKAGSEPETKALMRLVRRVRPQLAIYYHQHMGITVRARGVDTEVQRAYARRTGLPLRTLPNYQGTAVGWQNHLISGGTAFVVELKAGAGPGAAPRARRARRGPELPAMRVVLVRHGETEWSASGKHTSVTDVALTQRGREAAASLKGQLGDFALALASPRRRALETARLAGFEPEVTPDLVELDYGDYEGRTTKEIRETRPGLDVDRRLAQRRDARPGRRARRPRHRPRAGGRR